MDRVWADVSERNSSIPNVRGAAVSASCDSSASFRNTRPLFVSSSLSRTHFSRTWWSRPPVAPVYPPGSAIAAVTGSISTISGGGRTYDENGST